MPRYETIKRAHVELSSACNAACPNCPRNIDGGYTAPGLKVKSMNFNEFCAIFDPDLVNQMESFLFCGNYGDPMYCYDLPKILEYISAINPDADVRMHTNGGIRQPSWWAELATKNSRLTVIFSIDGLSDTNHIYRQGVIWDRVINNATAYIKAGGVAHWEFLIFKHNEHQIDIAQEYSESLGFKQFIPKRAFGFEYLNRGFGVMRVIDADGNFRHFIHEPSNKEQRNKVWTDESLIRGQYNLSPDSWAKVLNRHVNDHEKIMKQEENTYSFLDDQPINCMSINNQEIYVDAEGGVHPCCFLGHASQNVLAGLDNVQYRLWLINEIGIENINALRRPLKEILASDYFLKIQDSWKKTHRNGRIITCSRMCSNCKTSKDNLYVETKK